MVEMAGSGELSVMAAPVSFSDFPDDVQLCVLSFLSPSDLASFCCTSKLFASLIRADSKLWYALCCRRWGSKTEINKWGNGKLNFKNLYKKLVDYENLIGFWRRIGDPVDVPDANSSDSSALVFFEWGSSFITGSRVSPSKNGGCNVVKTPFIWISLSPEGQALTYLDPNGRAVSESLDCSEKDLVPINVAFSGHTHLFLEESRESGIRSGASSSNSGPPEAWKAGFGWQMNGTELNGTELNDSEIENVIGALVGSPPDRLVTEMYQQFANITSPGAGGERAWRRQRRRDRERRGMMKWGPEHLLKIDDSSPSPSRPLQGLWKGISEDMTLDFYLIRYDDAGGIECRRVRDSFKALSSGPPVFWTSSTTYDEPPLSPEEEHLYSTRLHLKPVEMLESNPFEPPHSTEDAAAVSRVLYINSSYDLVIPNLAETAANPRHVEGRIWQYKDGTFGFGFLRNNFIIDLNHIAQDGQLLDTN